MINTFFRYYLLIFMLLYCSFAALAQPIDTIYVGNFADTASWRQASNRQYSLRTEGSRYVLHNKTEGEAITSKKEVMIDTQRDFVIEAVFAFQGGEKSNAFGLCWGSDSVSEYNFFIKPNGEFCVAQWLNDAVDYHIYWSGVDAIRKGRAQNKLAVHKVNRTLKFYINDAYVGRTSFTPFFGRQLGFFVENKCNVAVSNLLITERAPAYPPGKAAHLVVDTVFFVTSDSDNMLATGEKGYLNILLRNAGKTTAHDIELLLVSDNLDDLNYNSLSNIAQLQPDSVGKCQFVFETNYMQASELRNVALLISEINSQEPLVVRHNFLTANIYGSTNSAISNNSNVAIVIEALLLLIPIIGTLITVR